MICENTIPTTNIQNGLMGLGLQAKIGLNFIKSYRITPPLTVVDFFRVDFFPICS
jgi:hypothetical protein